eukprot:scpid97951/ scgid19737/ Heat shock cognate 71 kDa protein; Heat shock 70 kDa protein 8
MPCCSEYTRRFTTYEDNQSGIEVRLYEGKKDRARDNTLLYTFLLEGISPAARQVPQVDVTFHTDSNGILSISAIDKSVAPSESNITITKDKNTLSKADIERMARDMEKYRQEDDARRKCIAAKHSLESYAYSTMDTIEAEELSAGERDKKTVLDKCNEVIQWLDENPTAEKGECEYQQKEA